MIVKFKQVDIIGFLSIGKATVNLDNQGLVYVVGKNESPGNQDSNGSGKSTIFEAIIYALTGSTLRGTRDVVNRYYPDGYCSVSLTVIVDEVEYVITRTRNHPEYKNNLLIERDGEDISGGTLRKSEAILEQELGNLTSSFVSGIIIMGQGLPNKFTDLGPTARKDRLEEFSQSSEFVDEIRTRISNFTSMNQTKLDDYRVQESRESAIVDMSKDRINSRSVELQELKENAESISDEDDEDIESYEEKLRVSKEELDSVTSSKDAVELKYREFGKMLTEYKMKVSTIDRNIEKMKSEFSAIQVKECPTCHQYIESPEIVKDIQDKLTIDIQNEEQEKSSISAMMSQSSKNLSVLENKLNQYNEIYNRASAEYLSIKEKIIELKAKKQSQENLIEELKKEILEWRDKMESATSRLNEITKEADKLSLKIQILEFLGKKVQKEFRNYLLIGVVDYLNSKLDSYSWELFGTRELKINLTDNQLFIEYDGRPYENLSGGERQRADLAIQFSLRDLLVNTLGFNCNLLVIDEGFDNLDSSGVESLIKVISNMSSIESVFTISHHTLSLPFDSTLTVNKGLNKVSSVL